MGYWTTGFVFEIVINYLAEIGFKFEKLTKYVYEIYLNDKYITRIAGPGNNTTIGDYREIFNDIINSSKKFDIGELIKRLENV